MKIINFQELWSIQEPLLAMAGIVEALLHFSGRIILWKHKTADLWVNIQLIKWKDRYEINTAFLDLYDTVYGTKAISFQRFLVSCISSIIFTLFFYFILTRIEQVFFDIGNYRLTGVSPIYKWLNFKDQYISHLHPYSILILLYDALGVNLLWDYISLIETGWVLKKASKEKSNLIKLFCLDIFLTTIIWIIVHTIAYIYTLVFINKNIVPIYYLYTIHTPAWPSYIFSTYTTSLIWFMFVFLIIIFALLKRVSQLFVKIIETKLVRGFPVFLFVGMMCLVSWILLLMVNFFSEHM